MSNRIKELRNHAGMSQQELGDRVGVDKTTIYRYEKGRTSLFQDTVLSIARVLGLSDPEQLLDQGGATQVALLGNVGAGAEVFPLDDENEWIDAPPGMTDPVAVRVVGRSMLPVYRPGDILFADREQTPTDDIIGKDCIVQVKDGPRLVKRVHAGALRRHFRLYSYDTQDETDDLTLEWASPIRWVAR